MGFSDTIVSSIAVGAVTFFNPVSFSWRYRASAISLEDVSMSEACG